MFVLTHCWFRVAGWVGGGGVVKHGLKPQGSKHSKVRSKPIPAMRDYKVRPDPDEPYTSAELEEYKAATVTFLDALVIDEPKAAVQKNCT